MYEQMKDREYYRDVYGEVLKEVKELEYNKDNGNIKQSKQANSNV